MGGWWQLHLPMLRESIAKEGRVTLALRARSWAPSHGPLLCVIMSPVGRGILYGEATRG